MGNVLVIRKLADKSSGERVVKYDPDTGVKKLINPATPGDAHEPWPLAGVQIVDAPDRCSVPTGWVNKGMAEGWLELEGPKVVSRPAGPAHDPHSGTHQFIHAEALVIHTVDGDVRYRVVHQPDKYATSPDPNTPADDDTPVTPEGYAAGETRVDWFYGLQREA